MKYPVKVDKKRFIPQWKPQNKHGLDIEIWAVQRATEDSMFLIVTKHLKNGIRKGNMGYCTKEEREAGILNNLKPEEIKNYVKN
jgi:hypothetical protein